MRRAAAVLLAWLACHAGTDAAPLSGPPAEPPAARAAEPLQVEPVASGVFVHFGVIEDWLPSNGGDVANLGFVVGSRCVAVIDTGGAPAIGQRLRAAVERETRTPICYVINTHAHPDHVLGNAAFVGPGTRFVAHARFAAALGAREAFFLNALQRDFGITMTHEAVVYPALQVTGALDLDLGDRVLTLHAWPTAHTDNDLTVYDQRTRTLFLGDLLFVRHIPVVDGSLRGWLAVMNDLQKLDVATAVPGHGAAGHDWPGVMAPQRAYLDGVLRETRAAIKARMTLAQAVDRVAVPPPASAPLMMAERFHRRNVTAAYAELEWEE